MAEFKSWRDFWHFTDAVMRQTRYFRTGDIEGFLETVRQTAPEHLEVVCPETPLWRAQLGCNWELIARTDVQVSRPFGKDRMKPPCDHVTEGRVNPRGIPCLYLATDQKTAIGEARPWVGSYVSVGLFKARRQIKVVNCVTGPLVLSKEECSAAELKERVWACMGDAFSHPRTPDDDIINYVPAQIIAELFKVNGFDGIKYRSSLGKGHNIALFDLDAAELTECHLVKVMNVECTVEEYEKPVYY